MRQPERCRREVQEPEGEETAGDEPGDKPAGETCNPVTQDDRNDLDDYPDQGVDQVTDLVDADLPGPIYAICCNIGKDADDQCSKKPGKGP